MVGMEWIVGSAVLLSISTVLVWMLGPQGLRLVRRQVKGFRELMPTTPAERWYFAAVAASAGICEEILYRGFGISYLRWLAPGIDRTAIIVIIGAAFGFAHLYQGPRNVVLTGIIGGVFASITLSTGSLVPAIVVHALVDLRVCFLPSRVAAPDAPGEAQSSAG